MADRVVTTKSGRIWLEDGIIHAVLLPGVDQTRVDAVEQIALCWELAEQRKRPVLVDLRAAKSVDRSARLYYAGPETAAVQVAVALVLGSPLTRALGNFFMGLNKTLVPTRLFTSETEAIAWLRGFLH